MHTKIVVYGVNNAGKSTLLNSLIEATVCESKITENTAMVTTLLPDAEKANRVYSVVDAEGRVKEYPLSNYAAHTTPADPDARLVLYYSGNQKTQTRIDDVVWIDVPGRDSVSKNDHNRRSAEFIADSNNYDLLLDVRRPRCSEHTSTPVPAPTPHIVVMNKVDELIDWDKDADPLVRLEETVQSYTETVLLFNNTENPVTPLVIPVSAIVGLASSVFDDTLLEKLLTLTHAHGRKLLSSDRFFEMDETKQILDESNGKITAPWWEKTRPAYPAIKVAIGLALTESITSPAALRERMTTFSGINVLRTTIRKLQPLTEYRRDTLLTATRLTSERLRNCTELEAVRALLTQTERLRIKHSTRLAANQEHDYFELVSAFLSRHATAYAKRAYLTSQAEQENEQKYAKRVNATISGSWDNFR